MRTSTAGSRRAGPTWATVRSRLRRAGIGAALAVVLGVAVLVPVVSDHSSASAATDGQMIMPVSGTITSRVGDGCHGNVRPSHQGIDIVAAEGQPIRAAYDGVIKTRSVNAGYGYFTDIEHAGGYVTRYAHMVAPGTHAPGTRVERGQPIGAVGKTGNATAFHLHFEVWRNGSVYTAINDGFTCLTRVTSGAVIPVSFPGLGTDTPAKPLVADYDGDGRSDLLVVAADSDLQIFPGAAGGGFGPAEIITSAWGAKRHLTHADLDADGHADMLVVRSDGVLELYSGSGGRGFDGHDIIGAGWYDMRHVASGADYTGDGRHDVLAVAPSGALLIHRFDRGSLADSITAGSGWQVMRHIVGGDFDGGGRGDIMAVDDAGSLYLYPGTGTGVGDRRRIGGGWSAFAGLTGGVDYTDDGRADLLAVTTSGQLLVYPGDGGGGFAAPRSAGSIPTGSVLLE